MNPFFILILLLFAPMVSDAQFFVSVNGSDNGDGSAAKPFASLSRALRQVRELRRLNDAAIANGAFIELAGGTYHLSEPVFIRPEDAGTAASPTVIRAKAGAVLSGGVPVTGWKKVTGKVPEMPAGALGKVWVADAPLAGGNYFNFRQLWVGNQKAVRARDNNLENLNRILSWDKKNETCWIPKPATDVSAVQGLEMYIHQWWAIASLRVKSVKVQGDSAQLSFYQPESHIQSEHPWPSPWVSTETGNSAYYLTNALQFLDEPGEWYLDTKQHKLYYWPRVNENMQTAKVVAPALETLLKVEGTAEQPVQHIAINGLTFEHTTWLRPSQQGHVPLQAGMYLLDAYKLKIPGTASNGRLENQAWVGRPAAAVVVNHAINVGFNTCTFKHLAATALDYHKGTKGGVVSQNVFADIGGNAILAGVFSDEAREAHLAYNPSDERDVCTGLDINNNLITDAGNEDWGCVGIGAGFVKHINIAHNDLSELPYSGISLGWGWTKADNVMEYNTVYANRIVRYARQMYDVAGIYTLSAQPATVISNNYIDSVYHAPYAHLPSHWFYLYTDEGTSHVTVTNNWTPSQKYLQNANGPGNNWYNNGPGVADSVKWMAGLQQTNKYIEKYRLPYNSAFTIKENLPVVIELIEKDNNSVDIGLLKDVLRQNNADEKSLYKWKNHIVIFAEVQDAYSLRSKIQKVAGSADIKIYYEPFYHFNRKYCADTTTANNWEHIILTANLVANQKMQTEYLRYHKYQFELWPEVAKGFCNASFQQLLLYRSGRQLMLIISIPKGESLNKLNPLTSKNNPRVDDWNNLMKKYQEGIEGARADETWVFLEKL